MIASWWSGLCLTWEESGVQCGVSGAVATAFSVSMLFACVSSIEKVGIAWQLPGHHRTRRRVYA